KCLKSNSVFFVINSSLFLFSCLAHHILIYTFQNKPADAKFFWLFLFSRFCKTLYSLSNFITHTLKFRPLFSRRIIKSPMYPLHTRRCHWAPISRISTKRHSQPSIIQNI